MITESNLPQSPALCTPRIVVEKPSEDGYKWRKYGQRNCGRQNLKEKGFVRSYYRCLYPHCLAKKKVQHLQDGKIAYITCLGHHHHPKLHSQPQQSLPHHLKPHVTKGSGTPTIMSTGTQQEEESELHPTKINLVLFPLNERTREGLKKDGHNPYLRLTLKPGKRISCVLKRLQSKWASSRVAIGELTLFPYNATANDDMSMCKKWSLSESGGITAADVHAAIGRPDDFRLRYGWVSSQNNGSTEVTNEVVEQTVSVEPDLVGGQTMVQNEEQDDVVEGRSSAGLCICEEPRPHNDLTFVSLLRSDSSNISIKGLLSDTFVSNSLEPCDSLSIFDDKNTCHPFEFPMCLSAKDFVSHCQIALLELSNKKVGSGSVECPESTLSDVPTSSAMRRPETESSPSSSVVFNNENDLGLSQWESILPYDPAYASLYWSDSSNITVRGGFVSEASVPHQPPTAIFDSLDVLILQFTQPQPSSIDLALNSVSKTTNDSFSNTTTNHHRRWYQ